MPIAFSVVVRNKAVRCLKASVILLNRLVREMGKFGPELLSKEDLGFKLKNDVEKIVNFNNKP
jgi:hypothetical protein